MLVPFFLLGSTLFGLRQSLWISQGSEGVEQTPSVALEGCGGGQDLYGREWLRHLAAQLRSRSQTGLAG